MPTHGAAKKTTARALDVTVVILVVIALAGFYQQRRHSHRVDSRLRTATEERDSLKQLLLRSTADLNYYKAVLKTSVLDLNVDLEGVDLDDKPVDLRLRNRVKPVLIYSIDPDCAVCRANLPMIKRLAAERPCDTEVIGLTVSEFDLIDKLRAEFALNFPVLRRASGSAWEVLPIANSPALVLIGPAGRMPEWWIGEITKQTEVQILDVLRSRC